MVFTQVKKYGFRWGWVGVFATVRARTALIWPNVLSWKLWAIVPYSNVAVIFLP